MVLVFTTTYRELYTRDLLAVCSRGIDEVVRYGYARKHFDPDLRIPKDIDGELALIIFAEYRSDIREYRYHPIRYAEIGNVDPNSISVSFDLTLRHFFALAPTGNARKSDELDDMFSRVTNRPLTKEQLTRDSTSKSYFILQAGYEFPTNKNPDEPLDWLEMIKHLSTLSDLRKTSFLKQFKPETKPKTKSNDREDKRDEKETLRLKNKYRPKAAPAISFRKLYLENLHSPVQPLSLTSGTTYEIVFSIYNGPDADKNIYPELRVNENISYGGPYLRQERNELTECSFRLVPSRSFSALYSPIVITQRVEADKKAWPIFENFAIIRPRGWLTAMVIILFAAGFILPNLVRYTFPSWDVTPKDLDHTIVKLIDAVAVVSLALASYLGFSKLPVK
jgi:hypothetical protein